MYFFLTNMVIKMFDTKSERKNTTYTEDVANLYRDGATALQNFACAPIVSTIKEDCTWNGHFFEHCECSCGGLKTCLACSPLIVPATLLTVSLALIVAIPGALSMPFALCVSKTMDQCSTADTDNEDKIKGKGMDSSALAIDEYSSHQNYGSITRNQG